MDKKNTTTAAFLNELKAFLNVIESSDLMEVEWEKGDYGFKISRSMIKRESPSAEIHDKKAEQILPSHRVISPAVGTFHFSEDLPLGSSIKLKHPLGYVKAVNVKHMIESEKPGKILEVYVEEGQPVEFGQVLFALEVPHVS